MQRRAAAVSAAFLLLIAAGAYAYIGVAQEPTLQFEPEGGQSFSTGDTASFGDTEYDVNVSGGEATFAWTNQSARYTVTWDNGSTVTLNGTDFAPQGSAWVVAIPNETNVSQFTLREPQNVTAILQNDSSVENQVLTDENGTRYVRYTNGSTRSLSEYLPERETHQLSANDTFAYQGNETTVAQVTPQAATLAWNAPRNNAVSAGEGENVTLGGGTYLAHFPNNDTVVLSQDFGGYQHELDRGTYFQERVNGLWGVTLLASIAAILLLAMAYLPSRY